MKIRSVCKINKANYGPIKQIGFENLQVDYWLYILKKGDVLRNIDVFVIIICRCLSYSYRESLKHVQVSIVYMEKKNSI